MIVLFDIRTGVQLGEYESEAAAAAAMREANKSAGWRRLGSAWMDGIECEWAESTGDPGYAPYAITEVERWQSRFGPEAIKQRNRYATEDPTQEMV
jgi:hypothetical protein